MIPELGRFTDVSLLLLRFMVGAVFVSSGWNDLKDPKGRAQSMGIGQGSTFLLGVAEVAGGVGVAAGVLTQLAALGLMLVMLGAIQKQIFVWHTGFWGKKGSGWHYDLMLFIMNLVIACTAGGRYQIWPGSPL